MLAPQMPQQSRQFLQLQPLTRIHQQRRPRKVALPRRVQLREYRNQLYRQIIDAVVAHVLKRLEDRALSRPRQTRKNDKLPAQILFSGSAGSALHGLGASQLFTRRWCVLGIRMSSRYLATVRRVTWMPLSSNFFAICSSVSGLVESSSSIIFLTSRFSVSSDIPPPSGPFTASLKNERSSITPCGVCAYLLATARLTVDGCTPTSSATSLIIIGFNASGPWSKYSPCRAMIDWQTRKIVCFLCSMFFINWIAAVNRSFT